MQKVVLTKAIPGYLEGEVLNVDERSAAALVQRGDAEKFDDSKSEHKKAAEQPRQAKPGHIVSRVVGGPAEEPADSTPAETEQTPDPQPAAKADAGKAGEQAEPGKAGKAGARPGGE